MLLGGGEHAAVVAEAARSAGWSVAGFLDDAAHRPQAERIDLARLGAIDDLEKVLAALRQTQIKPAAHAAVGDPTLRRRWLDLCAAATTPPVIHATAVVSPSATIGPGAFIGPLAVVNARAVIERGVIVNSGAIVEHDCALGAFCHVGPGAALEGGASVGPDGLVGINAAVLRDVRIGASATLGAGGVAVSDVPDDTTATGVPARPLAPIPKEAVP